MVIQQIEFDFFFEGFKNSAADNGIKKGKYKIFQQNENTDYVIGKQIGRYDVYQRFSCC